MGLFPGHLGALQLWLKGWACAGSPLPPPPTQREPRTESSRHRIPVCHGATVYQACRAQSERRAACGRNGHHCTGFAAPGGRPETGQEQRGQQTLLFPFCLHSPHQVYWDLQLPTVLQALSSPLPPLQATGLSQPLYPLGCDATSPLVLSMPCTAAHASGQLAADGSFP